MRIRQAPERPRHRRRGVVLLALAAIAGGLAVWGAGLPAPSSSLPQMLKIVWQKGPDLPQGFQDSSGGIVDHFLVTVAGFCTGQTQGVVNKLGKYPRGFLKKSWALNLQAPQSGWQRLPDFPGAARQALTCAAVDNHIYCWGGFSDFSPYCYRDGYELSRTDGQWKWQSLPELPWRYAGAGMCAVGPKIYWLGGVDRAETHTKFYTNSGPAGRVSRRGARLLVFDTREPQRGWQELPSCPGTPRWVPAMAAVKGEIYVLGGATGRDNPTGHYCTVVDNWKFDPARKAWTRLPDSPVSSGNFPTGAIVYQHRFILLIGGGQYPHVMGPSGTLSKPYGKTFKHYLHNPYNSNVWVFDTRTNAFGTATPLPLNNNLPMAVLEGNQLNLLGGETGGAVVDGEYFGHHPDLYLVGEISRVRH